MAEGNPQAPRPAVSPVFLKVAIHYHVSPIDHPLLGIPVYDDIVDEMLAEGLLVPARDTERRYERTEKLAAWICAICRVPFPFAPWVVEWPKEPYRDGA
jgi:hypothetical protein